MPDTKNNSNETLNMDTRTRSFIYFAQLSKQQVFNLYQIYVFDFKLFNYGMEGYGELNQFV